jgi:hypothetical protein
MTPQQTALAKDALAEMKTVSVAAPQPFDAQGLSDLLTQNNIHYALTDLADLTATGFSRKGMATVANLAKTFRPIDDPRSLRVSNATLTRVIAGEIVHRWRGRSADSLSQSDCDGLETAITEWFVLQSRTQLHAVPCIIAPYPAPAFTVGPVSFHHIHDFPLDRFGLERAQFWPEPTADNPHPKPGGFHFEQLLDLAVERRAPWIAIVEVPGRANEESIAAADIATDIALAALQLAGPGLDLRGVARATARAAPVWRADVWIQAGALGQNASNREPARAISPELFAHVLPQIAPTLGVMGQRLASYLGATSPVPDLDEAWCNAAYWYHEALAEPLDTVAVAKLEAAIEILFRSENMDGSKKRIISSFDAIFDLSETDVIPGSIVTVRQFTLAITTARSRVVHGTWPTLHTDLPGYKGQQPVSYNDVETLARLLLLQFAHHIDAYTQAGETDESTDAVLAWIKAKRLSGGAKSSLRPSVP